DMAVGLREIAPLAAILLVDVLAEEHEVVGKGEQLLEDILCFTQSAYTGQCFDIPKGADQKGRLGLTEIITVEITIKESMLAFELFFQLLQMSFCLFAARIQVVHHNELQCRSVEIVTIRCIGIDLSLGVITAFDVLYGLLL